MAREWALPCSKGKLLALSLVAALVVAMLYTDVMVAMRWEPSRTMLWRLWPNNNETSNNVGMLRRQCPTVAAGTAAVAAVSAPAVGNVMSAWDAVREAPYLNGMKRKCIIGTFGSDWDHIADLIWNRTVPFAINRYGDGERNLIKGLAISQSTQAFSQDKFWWDGGDSELGADLRWSLTGHFGQQFYYGFASPRDDGDGLHWYLEHTEQLCPFITYANLFVNHNYPRTKGLLSRVLEERLGEIVLVANHESIAGFVRERVVPPGFRMLSLPDDAAHFYKGESRLALIANVTALARSVTKHLFIVSGGPMAKPMIAHMWQANPTNQYVDFGSSLDELLKGRITRPYMTSTTSYAQQVDPPFTVDNLQRPVVVNYDYMGGR